MPIFIKPPIIQALTLTALLFGIALTSTSASSSEGIGLYYIRYDVKTSKHKIVDTNLIMIPGNNEYRVEKFSVIQTYGAKSATYNESETDLTKFAKENAIISLLRENGLRSVQSKDNDIVVSYEGVIRTPVVILEKGFVKKDNSYFIKIETNFSPVAFPDKWGNLKTKSRIKDFFLNFISFFK